MTLDELKQFMNWTDCEEATFEAVTWMVASRDREIEALKAEIRRLNEQLVAEARSNDNPRSQLIAVFEEAAEAMKKKTPKPLVGTCDGDLEP